MRSNKGYKNKRLGYGMWKGDAVTDDTVEYVNRLRDADIRTLREVVENLNSANYLRLPREAAHSNAT